MTDRGDGASAPVLRPVTLYPKRSTALFVLFISSLFLACGLWMGSSGEWIGYAIAGFFGLGIPVGLVQLLPGSGFLRIGPEGIAYASLFRRKSFAWSAFDCFYVVTMRQTGLKVHEMVAWDFAASYDGGRTGRALSRAIARCEGGLPDTYGKKAAELADLLNLWLVMSRSAGPDP